MHPVRLLFRDSVTFSGVNRLVYLSLLRMNWESQDELVFSHLQPFLGKSFLHIGGGAPLFENLKTVDCK